MRIRNADEWRFKHATGQTATTVPGKTVPMVWAERKAGGCEAGLPREDGMLVWSIEALYRDAITG